MPSKEILWNCEPRTKAKLSIVSDYLAAWFSILAVKKFKHVIYIDGFCGPGKYLEGEEGSPLIATRLANSMAQKYPGFKATLIFIDENPFALEHLATLAAVKKPHPNVTVEIKRGKFAEEVGSILDYLKQNQTSPTFSFVDPFGFGQSPYEKLKLLMHNEHSELFINFWCGFMNRFKEHPDLEVTQKIKDMIGSNDLLSVINAADPIEALCNLFETNLKNIGRFTLKFAMRDEGNIRDNAFFFCGRQPRGFEKIKEAMWKLDPEHGNEFSAHLNKKDKIAPATLFDREPQTAKLSRLLVEKFKGKNNISVDRVFKWVVEDTNNFLPKHARVELERLLSRNEIAFFDPDSSKPKRKSNTWAGRLLLSFK